MREDVRNQKKQKHEAGYTKPTNELTHQTREEAEEVLDEAHRKGHNALQMMAQVKREFGAGASHFIRDNIQGEPRDEPNSYGGCTINPLGEADPLNAGLGIPVADSAFLSSTQHSNVQLSNAVLDSARTCKAQHRSAECGTER